MVEEKTSPYFKSSSGKKIAHFCHLMSIIAIFNNRYGLLKSDGKLIYNFHWYSVKRKF